MADYPPYLNAHGYISKVLEAVKPAKVPPKFTQNFLESKLGIKSNSARAIIPFLKRIGFLTEAGIPTERYSKFRNATYSGRAIAEGILEGYAELYEINEYAHELSEVELEGLVLQACNAEKGQTSSAVVKSFLALKSIADFSEEGEVQAVVNNGIQDSGSMHPILPNGGHPGGNPGNQKLNLSYTINLNLPETSNPEVFDAIFQSLNRNILKADE